MRDKRRFRARLNLIGRRHECALQVKGKQVSAFHGCLYWQYPRLWYIDLVSSNGTTLNGRSIDCAELQIGDQLEIGEFILLYQRLSKGGASRGESTPASQPAAASVADMLPPDFEEDMPLDLESHIPLQLEEQLADDEHAGSSPVIPLDQADPEPMTSKPAMELAVLAPVQQTRQELATLQRRVEALTQLTAQVGKTAVQQLTQKTREAFEQERQRIAQELERRGDDLAREKAALESQWQTASRELASQVTQLRDEASLLARQRQAMEQSRVLWDAQRTELERQLRNYAEQLRRLEQAAGPGLPDPRTPLGLPGNRTTGVREDTAATALVLTAAQRGGALRPRSHVVDAQVDAAPAAASTAAGLPAFGAAPVGLAAPSAANSPPVDDVLEGSMTSASIQTPPPEPQAPEANGAERPAIKGRKPSAKGKDVFGHVTDRMVEMELGRRKSMIVVGIAAGVVVVTLAAAMVLTAVLLR
jgi:pSer/pThr/pTyr-binding forkhead associated (FHA) protein